MCSTLSLPSVPAQPTALNGTLTDRFPYSLDCIRMPILNPSTPISPAGRPRSPASLAPPTSPKHSRSYIAFIERQLGVPVVIVSVGPDRKQTDRALTLHTPGNEPDRETLFQIRHNGLGKNGSIAYHRLQLRGAPHALPLHETRGRRPREQKRNPLAYRH